MTTGTVDNPADGEARARCREAPTHTHSVFILAGEPSGDWAGARLAVALRRKQHHLAIRGIGGRRMAESGVELLADSSSWAAIGIFEALSKVPGVARTLRLVRRHLSSTPPSALVLIDSGAVNLRVARFARGLGLPVLYYFPPGSWRRTAPNPEIREVVDAIATPFPWSEALLSGGRARVEWVGHPVVESARPVLSREQAAARYGVDLTRPVVALAPGSRRQEIHYLLPVLAAAARELQRTFPQVQYLLPVAASCNREHVSRPLDRAGLHPLFLEGVDYDALQLSDAAVVCSGSVTLEFACLGIPMVVVYRASMATTLQFRLVRGLIGRQRFAAMPNIIAGREVVPELLGSRAEPRGIAAKTAALLQDPCFRARMRADLATVASVLGPPGASDRTAEMVLGLVERGCRA